MSNETTDYNTESRPEWDHLEDWLRGQVQGMVQYMLEEEVTEFLGRLKSARRSDADNDSGYRNGYAPARKLTLSSGTIRVRRPRVRDTEELFVSRLLPLFVSRTSKVSELIPELYLHGLSEGDFDLALRGLLGDDAPLSASTVSRLKERWNVELAEWRGRRLDELEVVYVWVDGVYVKAGFEREKSAVLVVIGALSDGSKVVLSAEPGYRESTQSWSEVLRDLRDRGMGCPQLVVGDGHLGIWGALRNVYPEASEQRCWNHKIINVLDKLPKRQHDQAKLMLRNIPYAESRSEAERMRDVFVRWSHQHSYEAAAESLEPRLGSDGDVLRVPQGALETHPDNQSCGVTVRGAETQDRRGQALQAGGSGNSCDLEDADGGRGQIQKTEGARADEGRLPGCQVQGWSRHKHDA